MSSTTAPVSAENAFGSLKNVKISSHPVLRHKISILRSSATCQRTFRSVLREVTYHLGYEATGSLKTREVPVSVSIGKASENDHLDCVGVKIADNIALIPILRSGLGMADSMMELLPNASVHHIGMYHIPGTAPVQYFNRLPKTCTADVAFIVDPVIASAETMMAVLAILKKVRLDVLLKRYIVSCIFLTHFSQLFASFSFFATVGCSSHLCRVSVD